MIAVALGIAPYASAGGPFWGKVLDSNIACQKYWWRDILYIQNLFPVNQMCMGHTWYLANDFQFYLVCPIFVYAFLWKPWAGYTLVSLAAAASTAWNAVIAAQKGYSASPLFDMNYFSDIYIKPWTRIQPYLVGVCLAFLLHDLQKHEWLRTLVGSNRDAERLPSASPRYLRYGSPAPAFACCSVITKVLMMLIAGVTFLACTFGTHGLYQSLSGGWTTAENVSYISLSRLAWGIALSLLSLLCYYGHGGVVNSILADRRWEAWGKLTYGAYLIHPIIITIVCGSMLTYTEYSLIWYLSAFTVYSVWATGAACILWLALEKPCANLLAVLLSFLR